VSDFNDVTNKKSRNKSGRKKELHVAWLKTHNINNIDLPSGSD
jgi:hypothetical protein